LVHNVDLKLNVLFILLLLKLLFDVDAIHSAPQTINAKTMVVDEANTYIEYGVPYPLWRGAGNSLRTRLHVRLHAKLMCKADDIVSHFIVLHFYYSL